MALLCVVAATHCMPTINYKQDVEKEIRESSDGVKELYKYMQNFYNNLKMYGGSFLLSLLTLRFLHVKIGSPGCEILIFFRI